MIENIAQVQTCSAALIVLYTKFGQSIPVYEFGLLDKGALTDEVVKLDSQLSKNLNIIENSMKHMNVTLKKKRKPNTRSREVQCQTSNNHH